MDVPAIDVMFFIETVIQPDDLLTKIEGVRLLERSVIANRGVVEARGKANHRAIDSDIVSTNRQVCDCVEPTRIGCCRAGQPRRFVGSSYCRVGYKGSSFIFYCTRDASNNGLCANCQAGRSK